ncbi:PilZ domain-containing protein [Sphingosinicella rhizophila]|uniref:PilZ domain-containing protein n=1 Tax=Sphingosinicella rhizophila TaxID=3050082 RepID=A0ABU3Q4H6_9SPHN|nr:PilZ domain-containing protein [Sphingosinicella sp. GR2756]MDT9598301.1 PilZ domain-containing protein [Sphingosinicella sp. GR2756]
MMGSQAALSLVTNGTEPSRRASMRHRALLLAKLVTTTNEYSVRMRDLSATGALVEGEGIPRPGTDIILRRGNLEVLATVRWSTDNHAGLEFEDPLSEGQVWAQINPALEPPAARLSVYRPGFKGDQVKAEERAIERARQIAAARKFLST